MIGLRTRVASAYCLLLSMLMCAPCSCIAQSSDANAAFARYLTERVAGLARVGVLVGVVDHGHTRVSQAGSAGLGTLDEHTVFEIGSITKVFTAIILAKMVEDGEVRLNDPIEKYLPSGVHSPTFGGVPITLLNLAEQNSGLPRDANFDVMDPKATAAFDTDKVYEFLGKVKLLSKPGDKHLYSNFGVALLGDLLARRAGTTYAHLVQIVILQPLKMRETYLGTPPQAVMRLAPPRSGDGLEAPSMDFAAGFEAAGAIRSTLHDMLLFLKANLHPPSSALGRAMSLAQEPRIEIPSRYPSKIGLLWMTQIQPTITWHNGGTFGYRSFIGFDRTKDKGVVVLSNSTVSVDDIGFHLLDPERPLRVVSAIVSVELETLQSYAGTYSLDDADKTRVDVKARADGLLVTVGPVRFLLRPTSRSTFVSNDAPGTFSFKDGGLLIEQPGQPTQHGTRL